jgi:hypothetical protein
MKSFPGDRSIMDINARQYRTPRGVTIDLVY